MFLDLLALLILLVLLILLPLLTLIALLPLLPLLTLLILLTPQAGINPKPAKSAVQSAVNQETLTNFLNRPNPLEIYPLSSVLIAALISNPISSLKLCPSLICHL
jgi:ABC-type bacteriocin/lantibiotic exporter with double-glycine peptidase domain